MAVDKNLFLYDLAVVAIMKNEEPYIKEWVDYHLLAGVDHFFIYDNEETDSQQKILQPYIDSGLVTHIKYPGKARQYEAYNAAIQNYRFFCKYIAFIDADEFIVPQSDRKVTEVVDEILENKPNAGGLGVNIYYYGSNFHKEADFSKGVLERFTRRAPTDWTPILPNGLPGGTAHVKTVTNPRKVNFFYNPHFVNYFEGFQAINENGGVVPTFSNNPPTVKKIAINHYVVKSREEYLSKISRGTADAYHNIYNLEKFKTDDHNEVFDDGILKYREKRQKKGLQTHKIDYWRVYTALLQNLANTMSKNPPREVFVGRLETFLTCRKVAEHLSQTVLEEKAGKFLEEAALDAVYKTLSTNISLQEVRLLIAELPKILPRNYPVVQDIRKACMILIPQLMNMFRVYNPNAWKEFVTLRYVVDMLQNFDSYEPK